MSTTLRMCEIVTKLVDENGNQYIDIDNIDEILNSKRCIDKYARIIHDRDVDIETGRKVDEHIHIVLHFDSPQHVDNIAKWFNVSPNFVNRIKGRFVDCVKYLTHANAPQKYQYDIEDVVANFDVLEYIINNPKGGQDLDNILARILSGEIREYNKTTEIDNMLLVKKAKFINEAFKVRQEYMETTQKDRCMECIYITGEAGAGKTTYARELATKIGLDYYVSSGSNDVLDGYRQQPCIILDDIRATSLRLSDLLKLLDNNTVSTINSRYKNKYVQAELIIITTVLSMDDFYQAIFSNSDEPITQLKRRCKTYIQMTKDNIFYSCYDANISDYGEPKIYRNSIIKKFESQTNQDNNTRFILPELEEINNDSVDFIDIENNATPFV